MLENCKQMSNNHPFAITAFLLIWHLFFQLTSYMKLRNYTAEEWNIDTWQHIESAWEWGTTDAHKLTKRGCTCYSFHENTIHWLTICIRFACLFCKSQKWVAVATATCYLACGWEMSLGVPFKKQIQHALCCSSHPRGTNLLTGCLFFQSFKKLDCFCLLHLTVTHIYWKGKKKKKSIKMLLACMTGTWERCCLYHTYFYQHSSDSYINSSHTLTESAYATPNKSLRLHS